MFRTCHYRGISLRRTQVEETGAFRATWSLLFGSLLPEGHVWASIEGERVLWPNDTQTSLWRCLWFDRSLVFFYKHFWGLRVLWRNDRQKMILKLLVVLKSQTRHIISGTQDQEFLAKTKMSPEFWNFQKFA